MRTAISLLCAILLALSAQPFLVEACPAHGIELVEAIRPRLTHLDLKLEDLRLLAGRQVVAHGLAASNPKEMAAIGAVVADGTVI